jgi:nucleoside 2-deoxyribosyltransferase
MARVYCAGPLFNAYEQAEMSQIASVLEEAGYSTFLPQRDGLEFTHLALECQAHSMRCDVAHALVQRAIFALDIYELLGNADAVVANLNGRVPDEGAIVEAALAWHSGKALGLYKADTRATFDGSDNPMLTGLGGFCLITQIPDLPGAVRDQLGANRDRRLHETVAQGQHIAEAYKNARGASTLTQLLPTLFARNTEGVR